MMEDTAATLKQMGDMARVKERELANVVERRDALVRAALRGGATEREVAEVVGLSPPRVHQIATR